MDGTRRKDIRGIIFVVSAILCVYLLLASGLGLDLTEHSPYDSYTLQALAWRDGRVSLDRDYPWLELAYRDGEVYVSFPPFPTVPMFLLTFIFEENTPSMLVNTILFTLSGITAYILARRRGMRPETAAFTAVFWVCGCNLLEVSLYGGVWNIAQGMSFFLTLLSFELLERETDSSMFWSPVLIACAVGCRPFQAVYVPYVLLRMYGYFARDGRGVLKTLAAMLPRVILPGAIACSYAVYNYIRFDDVFEFGHNYLLEYTVEGGTMLSFGHFLTNLKNVMRMPYFENGRLMFYAAGGFAFWLCNPAFCLSGAESIRRAFREGFDAEDIVLFASLFIHFNLMMLHSTMGGWQFGTRYLVDLLPAAMVFMLRGKRRLYAQDIVFMLWGVAFNIYGAAILHTVY